MTWLVLPRHSLIGPLRLLGKYVSICCLTLLVSLLFITLFFRVLHCEPRLDIQL